MNQDKLFAPLQIMLPNIDDDQDQCVHRLQELLESDQQIDKVHLTRQDDKAGFCIHYNTDVLGLDQIKSMIAIAGAQISDRFVHQTLRIDGMDCHDCANIIEHSLEHLDGVLAAKVGYASQQLRIEYDSDIVSLKDIVKKLKRLGYTGSLSKPPKSWWRDNGEIALSLVAGFFLITGWIGSFFVPSMAFPFYLTSFAFGGLLTFRDSIQTIMQKRFDIDVLMVFAAMGAVVLGEWGEGALLLFLFSFGHALEHKAMHRAQDAVHALAKLAPKTALVVRDGQSMDINVEDVQMDDVVVVKPGMRIPIDGLITDGDSSVDQSPITGESIPVDKAMDDTVFAGTINGEGLLKIKVTHLSEDSTLNRMVRMVLEADTQKSPTQRFTDKFVKIFVPIVLLGVLALIFIPVLLGFPWQGAFYRAMAVLVAASPCALAISTPAAVLSAVACAAQRGVLIKGGAHLENLGRISAIAFDKTGTLTLGQPEVQTVVGFECDEKTVLKIAASVEKMSHHPLAAAVVRAAQTQKIKLSEPQNVQQITGKGMIAKIDDQLIQIGALHFFEEIPDEVMQAANHISENGQTIMVVKQGEQWLGVIGLADTVRPEVRDTIAKLHAQGLKNTVMLTGDNANVAQAIAAQIGIDQVHANLLPEDKLNLISKMEETNPPIAMVGDGVNDAPALARATVGIAMGGAGTDVALEASDVSLMADDLSQLPFAIRLARTAENVIRTNLFIALGVVGILLVLTATGLAGIGPAIIIHEGSTLVVVLNALRLLKTK